MWLAALFLKPFIAFVLLAAGLLASVAVERFLKDGRVKRLLLLRIS